MRRTVRFRNFPSNGEPQEMEVESNYLGITICAYSISNYPTIADAERLVKALQAAIADQRRRKEAAKNARKDRAKARKPAGGTPGQGKSK